MINTKMDTKMMANTKNTKTKLIIFDYDGVIVDSIPLIKSFYDMIIEKYNKKRVLTLDEFRKIMELEWWKTLKAVGFTTDDEITQISREFHLYMTEYRDRISLINGMKDVIEKLWKNYKLAIVSNSREDFITERLSYFNMLYRFEFVVDNSYGLKPEPTQIHVCLKKLGIKPEEAVMIGDMEGDIVAAKKAGLKKTIGVTFGAHHKERLNIADAIAHAPEEILGLVE